MIKDDFIQAWNRMETAGVYEEACRSMEEKLREINSEVSAAKGRCFIKEITSRVKTAESCYDKLLRKGYETEAETAASRINDIAGVRAVCYFLDDLYELAQLVRAVPQYEVVKYKDYVKKPKASGYQSIHLILRVPVGDTSVKTELQLRTQAMDFWSDIEHHFVYKTYSPDMNECEAEFLKCSKAIQRIDKQMLKIRRKIER